MRKLVRALLISFWVPATLFPVSAQDGATEGEREQSGDEENQTVPPVRGSIIGIGEYAIGIRVGEFSTTTAENQSVAEIVNPFRIRKRGRYYGSLYEFHRNDNLDARNFFDPVGQPLPEFKRNQFGVSLGAFLSDRVTIFGSYDSLRIIQGSTELSHVPTPAMKQGDFSALPVQLVDPFTGDPFENNQIPFSRIHPVTRNVLPTLEDPNLGDAGRNYVNNQPVIENEDKFLVRVDYEFSGNSKIYADYRFTDSDQVNVADLPTFGTNGVRRNQEVSVDYTHTFSERWVSSLRLEFERLRDEDLSRNAGQVGLLDSLGISGVGALDELDEGYPEFRISGYSSVGDGTRFPQRLVNNRVDLEGNFTYARGRHDIQFGSEISFQQSNDNRSGGLRRGRFDFDGGFTGDAFADFLLGIPKHARRGNGSDRTDLRAKRWKSFVRDNWKLNPRFDLSLSLRYNYLPLWRSVHDNVSSFYPLALDPVEGEIVVSGSERARMLGLGLDRGQAAFLDGNDWAPGIGIAYSPFGNNLLVLRSSYQINHNALHERRAAPYVGRNFPFYFVEKADSSPIAPEIDLSEPFQSLTPAVLSPRTMDQHIRNAYAQEWRLTIQNEPVTNWNLEVSYVGRKSTHIAQVMTANAPPPGPGPLQERRPNPAYGEFDAMTGSASSIGHSLEIDLTKRFSQGFSLQSGFTWEQNLSDQFNGDPSNPRNLRAERGRTNWDMPRQFFLNYIFDLPFGPGRALSTAWAGNFGWLLEGWSVSGITTIAEGRPFYPILEGDPNNDGVSGDRPDRFGSGILDSSERSVDHWFNTADFAEPAAFAFGNSGRNILLSPGEKTWDISVSKRTRVSDDGGLLEFRLQLFNAFNHSNFEAPDVEFGTSVFGKIFGAERAREIEIALKYSF